jgi:hypothetical protein
MVFLTSYVKRQTILKLQKIKTSSIKKFLIKMLRMKML